MSSLFKEEEQIYLDEINGLLPFVTINTSLQDPFIINYTSDNIESMTGYKQQDFLNNSFNLFSIVYLDDLKNVEEQYSQLIYKAKKQNRLKDFRIKKKNNEIIYVCAYLYIISDSITILMNDVSDYYNKLSGNDKIINRYKQLMITINEGIWDWNVQTDKVYYSHRWKEMLGYDDNEITGALNDWKNSVHPEDLDKVLKEINNHFDGKTRIYENKHRLRKKDGSYIWVRDRGIKQINSDGQIERMIGSHRDITGEKEARENLEKMIITDEMTSLFNRRHYEAQIRDEILRAERYNSELSILMIDIDLFKNINDTYGHRAGDIALVELAKVIKNKIRNTDTAYRTGGEEFIVIAPVTSLDNAQKAAERLRIAVSEIKIETKYGSFGFTISLGITTFIKGDNYGTLNERADVALYQSKDSGRNCSSVNTSN